jgi:hypothetical protein
MRIKAAEKLPQDWLVLALVGLLIQGFWALRLEQPAYMDAAYYTTNGQRLAAGEGWTEMVIWQFLDEPAGFPTASHTYWMPFASLLAAAGYGVLESFRGAQLPFWLLTGLLPLLSYTISRQLSGERWQAWAAGLLTAAGGFYAAVWNQPETFAPFAWAGGLCLLFLAWGLEENGKEKELRGTCPRKAEGRNSGELKKYWDNRYCWLLAGVAAGVAHLTRADGVLFLLLGYGFWLYGVFRTFAPKKERRSWVNGLWLTAGYLVIMGGWFWHNMVVIGRPLPTVGTQTIFLTNYDDLFAYGRSFSLGSYLAWGWGALLRSKLFGLWLAIQSFVALLGLIFLTPFILVAWWRLARRPESGLFLRPLTVYTLLLFGVMSLVFTYPGERGGLFHSTAALWPWVMALVPVGVSLAVEWMAARLPHWQPERAKRLFTALFVGVAFVLTLAIGLGREGGEREAAVYQRLDGLLPPGAVVMVADAPSFYYHTGRPALSIPNEPVEVMLAAAGRYGATHLILDELHPAPLHDIYTGEVSAPGLALVQTLETYRLYVIEATE